MGKAHAIPGLSDRVFYFRNIGITKQGSDKTTFTTLINCFKKYETKLKTNWKKSTVKKNKQNRKPVLVKGD